MYVAIPSHKTGILKMKCGYKVIATIRTLIYTPHLDYLYYSGLETALECDVEYLRLRADQHIPDGYTFVGTFGTDLLYLKIY